MTGDRDSGYAPEQQAHLENDRNAPTASNAGNAHTTKL